jgi:tripartite-type tricarboxylate transporter receptor subunit TctC
MARLLLISLFLLSGVCVAQDWPTRPIRLIIPFPAGTTDILGRAYATRAQLGQPVVAENVPGASGAIGYQRVARAAPDGYTLAVASTGTFAVSPSLNPKVGYDPLRDFTPIAMYTRLPIVLVVHPETPAQNVKELIDYAKRNPGKLNYASVSPGTTSHILGEMMKLQAGIDVVHIPYKGGAPALTALLAGEVHMLFSSLIEAMGHIQSGRIRALGLADARRVAALPNVPTLPELGLAMDTPIWYGLFAPAGTPEPIVRRIAADVQRIAGLDDMKRFLASQGGEATYLGPEPFREHLARELEKYGRVVREAKLGEK